MLVGRSFQPSRVMPAATAPARPHHRGPHAIAGDGTAGFARGNEEIPLGVRLIRDDEAETALIQPE